MNGQVPNITSLLQVIDMEEDEVEAEAEVVACVGAAEDSDSAESSKSAFEIIEKSKDD